MKERIVLRFTYDRNQNLIIRSDRREFIGLTSAEALKTDEAKKLLADVKNLSAENFNVVINELGGDTFVKSYGSRSGDGIYVLKIKRRKNGTCDVAFKNIPLIQDTKNSLLVRIVSALVVVFVVAIGVSLALYMRSDMYEKKNAEAGETVEMVSEQIDRTVTAEFNAWFKEVEMIGTLLKDYDSLTGRESEVDAVLNSVRESLSFKACGVLIESGDLYFSQDTVYNISYENLAKKLILEDQPAVDVMDIMGGEYIVFGIPFEGNARRNAGNISAICGVAEVSSVSQLISINAFNKQALVSIIKSDGFRVAVSDSAAVAPDGYPNLFDIVRERVSDSDYAAFEEKYASGDAGTLKIENTEGDYYLYYSLLHVGYGGVSATDMWHLLIFVPETAIFNYVNRMFSSMLTVTVSVLLVASVVIAMFVLTYLRKRNNDMLLSRRAMEVEMLETSAKQAEEASLAKTMFFANMSHDMRTPLNGIIGMSAIAKKHLGDTQVVADCFQKIDGASEHLLSLINNVLDMSRIESKKVEIVKEAMNVNTLIDECHSIMEGQVQSRNVNLEVKRENILHPGVLGDDMHLRQVLINLLGNAVKFTPAGGTVEFISREVSFDGTAGTVGYEFIVKDNGIGMSPEFVKKMFEPFAREHDDSGRTPKGSGLGLSIARQLIELMGGTIGVKSEEGKGTEMTVSILFPVGETAAEESSGKESEETHGGEDIAGSLKGTRVLLVEDNDLNREIAQTLLEESGIIVECAENGKIACDMFSAHTEKYYDVILMDVMMPVMDGIEATKTIRSSNNPNAQSVIIVAMTANAFEDDVRRTREAGMDDHLSKPIRINEVLKTLNRLLNPSTPPPPRKKTIITG